MTQAGAGLVLAGRYRLLDQVAVGAMGEVWRAHDDRLDRDVAVKVLRPELADDDAFLDRFRTEARHAASVRHPHVAAVHDYGEDPEVLTGGTATAYLVMDLLQGRPLNAVLAEGGPLPAREVAGLLAQVADALAAAHRIGLVHRDVKPANLVVSWPPGHGPGTTGTPGDGSDDDPAPDVGRRPDDVTVTDFGIARAADAVPVTRTGLVMGTAEYLSPEQARGERATTASDVYSLGVVAYELLTGEPPFTGDNPADVARAHVQDPLPPLPGTVPEAMRTTVARCLAKSPGARPDVVALAARLRALAEGTDPVDDLAPPATAADQAPPETTTGADLARPRTTTGADPAGPAARPDDRRPRSTGPAVPRTAELPVVGPAQDASGTGRPAATRVTPTRRRRPLRAPLVALLALVALLLLATLLQAFGLVGGGDGPSAAGLEHVTGSPWTTIDKDGR